ncbi:MAG TPA: hypothetical protein VIM00_13690 [Candidatus Acidoferrum sp.]|jgi:hypothetical protein
MRFPSQVARAIFAAAFLFSQPLWLSAQKPPDKTKHVPKTIWNFEGGVFLETDGSLGEHTCFRLAGRVTAGHFFDDLKRVDDDEGTRYLRGKEPVTDFPEALKLLFIIHDQPCSAQVQDADRVYLTREMMGKLHLELFWKRGVELRKATDFKILFFNVKRIPPYATELAAELPERLEWAYELEVPSAGVPLTDGLVLIVRREDGRVAARVAARL